MLANTNRESFASVAHDYEHDTSTAVAPQHASPHIDDK